MPAMIEPIQEEAQAFLCPGCLRVMDPKTDPQHSDVTHYRCGCGYGLGIKRDALGIVRAWREGDEGRN